MKLLIAVWIVAIAAVVIGLTYVLELRGEEIKACEEKGGVLIVGRGFRACIKKDSVL